MIAPDAALFELSDLESCRNQLVSKIDAGTLLLPDLPETLRQLIAFSVHTHPSPDRILKVIKSDPFLATRVLRAANAQAKAAGAPAPSLDKAAEQIGVLTLARIAIAFSVGHAAFHAPTFEDDIRAAWRHALASAVFGREIAGFKQLNTSSLFLCGLLHDIGKPAVLRTIADWEKSECTELPMSMVRNMVDQFHCAIGRTIAQLWNLPAQIQISCASYPFYADAPSFPEETAATYLADKVATWATQIVPLSDRALHTDPVWGALGVRREDFQTLLSLKKAVLGEVATLEAPATKPSS